MMTTLKATILFDTTSAHPDGSNVKGMVYSDTYRFNTDMFGNSLDLMTSYIKRDLALIAGGGYNSEHIENVTFSIGKA